LEPLGLVLPDGGGGGCCFLLRDRGCDGAAAVFFGVRFGVGKDACFCCEVDLLTGLLTLEAARGFLGVTGFAALTVD
jgi:hypothetical protein